MKKKMKKRRAAHAIAPAAHAIATTGGQPRGHDSNGFGELPAATTAAPRDPEVMARSPSAHVHHLADLEEQGKLPSAHVHHVVGKGNDDARQSFGPSMGRRRRN